MEEKPLFTERLYMFNKLEYVQHLTHASIYNENGSHSSLSTDARDQFPGVPVSTTQTIAGTVIVAILHKLPELLDA